MFAAGEKPTSPDTVRALRGNGDFSIGSKVWPGTSKLIEEMGELQQVLGKLIQCPDTEHWDGNLRAKLVEEIADARAAIWFFMDRNMTVREREAIDRRCNEKIRLFEKWHEEQST